MKRFYIVGAAAGVIIAAYFSLKPGGLTETGWRCLLATLFTAVLWMTESLPIPITSLLRIVILMNWEFGEKFPWGILLLFGAGFSIADSIKDTGVSIWLGNQITSPGNLPEFAIVAVVCLLVTFLTEVTSNTATCVILMPVMISAAAAAKMHPYMLMLPAAISCSCAFMLPVATPPNAIVFGMGNLRVRDMAI